MRLKVLTLALVIGSTSTLVQGQKENSREVCKQVFFCKRVRIDKADEHLF